MNYKMTAFIEGLDPELQDEFIYRLYVLCAELGAALYTEWEEEDEKQENTEQ